MYLLLIIAASNIMYNIFYDIIIVIEILDYPFTKFLMYI